MRKRACAHDLGAHDLGVLVHEPLEVAGDVGEQFVLRSFDVDFDERHVTQIEIVETHLRHLKAFGTLQRPWGERVACFDRR